MKEGRELALGDFFLSIDIGTSSVRAALFDKDGYLKYIESAEYSLITSDDGKAEINPDLVFNAAIEVIRNCVNYSAGTNSGLAGIGISCHMHSLLLVDKEGKPLTNLITWADNRAKAEADFISQNFDVDDLYSRTGCRVQHPLYPLSKILWFKRNEPEIFSQCYKFITIKEYILFRLFGQYVVDYTLASCQGYYNIHMQNWDGHLVHDILGITAENLSEVVECTYCLRGLKQGYERILGIPKDIPFVIGSGDGIMANIGCGVNDDTSFSSTIGTSGAIRTAVNRPLLDSKQRTWCYSFAKDIWVAGGAINNGGIVLKWLREEFRRQFESDAQIYGESIYKLFDRYASEIQPGSEGLIFLPYLTGERCPDWNANARGLMFGLGFSHGRKHIIRAAMEGVMYRMYSVYEVISKLRNTATQIKANGGYVKSDLWMQMQADIFNKEILVSGVGEASALGAAYICMFSLGAVRDLKQILPSMHPRKVIVPNPEHHEVYTRAYELSQQIYNCIYNREEKN